MTLEILLTELSARDVVLTVERGRLVFDAPTGALTPELRAAVSLHRAELIRRLSTAATSTAETAPAPSPPRIDFSRWVCRYAADGMLGWEAPDLPESTRWWARPARPYLLDLTEPAPAGKIGAFKPVGQF